MEALRAMKFMRPKQEGEEFANVVKRIPVEKQDIPIPEGFEKLTVPPKSEALTRVPQVHEPEVAEKKDSSVKPRKSRSDPAQPTFEVSIQNSTDRAGDKIRITYDRSLDETFHAKARQKYVSSKASMKVE
ncbi:type II secretory pathway component ExeA [Perkinsela sp. CCAP 1560/4]|nr:type II secretory pathway component ExeA [Perkinsela sp. CCAP 1560/4]|eukprot:KNH09677.1 type II secretory pathway component ExeA [Perkinsela sp. CCAP 1560/4]